MKAKADCDITKLKEKLLAATEALGDQNVDGGVAPGYGWLNSLKIFCTSCHVFGDIILLNSCISIN